MCAVCVYICLLNIRIYVKFPTPLLDIDTCLALCLVIDSFCFFLSLQHTYELVTKRDCSLLAVATTLS